jgi:hypothetical protein
MATLIAYGKGPETVALEGDLEGVGMHSGPLVFIAHGGEQAVSVQFLRWLDRWEVTISPTDAELLPVMVAKGPFPDTPQVAIGDVERLERLG